MFWGENVTNALVFSLFEELSLEWCLILQHGHHIVMCCVSLTCRELIFLTCAGLQQQRGNREHRARQEVKSIPVMDKATLGRIIRGIVKIKHLED